LQYLSVFKNMCTKCTNSANGARYGSDNLGQGQFREWEISRLKL